VARLPRPYQSPALKQFVNAEIANQQLLDLSSILFNGVCIALNLQLVE